MVTYLHTTGVQYKASTVLSLRASLWFYALFLKVFQHGFFVGFSYGFVWGFFVFSYAGPVSPDLQNY